MENNEQPALTRAEKRARKREAKMQFKTKERNGRVAQFAGLAILLVALFLGWNAFQKNDQGSSSNVATPVPGMVGEFDRTKGAKEAAVVLTEYSDFQCPACGAYYPLIKQISEEYKDRIAFVYRHFPLYSIHPNAEEAAWAAEAAGQQGKFWEMHDLLFEKQQQWSNERNVKNVFAEYADSLGLDRVQWESDYESEFVRDKVLADVTSANKERVNATPTFFINGSRMTQVGSLEEFRAIIDTELEIASGTLMNNVDGTNEGNVSIEIEDGENTGIQVEAVKVTGDE
jgi:predicted DsbA family dithiol-disulfide isomerase